MNVVNANGRYTVQPMFRGHPIGKPFVTSRGLFGWRYRWVLRRGRAVERKARWDLTIGRRGW